MPALPTILTIKQKFLDFLHIQLFVTLIALPILLCWGMPLSLMTIVGNFIFAPFLTIFLLLSSLVFFTELFTIPNAACIVALEKFLSVWSGLIQYGSPSWLVGFVQPSWLVLFTIPLSATAMVHYKKFKLHHRVISLSVLLTLFINYLFFLCAPDTVHVIIPCNKGQVILAHHNKQTVVIDPGYIAQASNGESWIEHTLFKEMNKHLGSTTIHHLVILQPSARVFETVTSLCSLTNVENVYISTWQGLSTHNQWKYFFTLRTTLEKKKINLIRVANPVTISFGQDSWITITPKKKMIHTSAMRYPGIHVNGQLGSKKVRASSAKLFTK